MNTNKKHINFNINNLSDPDDFMGHVEILFNKNKEEVWTDLNKKLMEKPSHKVLILKRYKILIAAAAVILLFAGVYTLLRFYTSTVTCPEGKHLSYVLPDGSKIEMNVDTKIKYRPFWWRFSRKLEFEGEAYFQVEKGKKFEIESALGTTEVVGTTFNIYSRENEYKVTCITGRVKVTSFKSKVAFLSPNIEGSILSDGVIMIQRDPEAEESIAWVSNMFNFSAKPLGEVFKEIGRQYGVKIILNDGTDYLYTGYFLKDKPVEDVLNLVCKPFGLNYTRVSDKEYKIFQN